MTASEKEITNNKKNQKLNKKKLYIAKKQNEFLLLQSKKTKKEIFRDFETCEQGLKQEDIENKLERYGQNSLVNQKRTSWIKTLFHSFFSVFCVILLVIVFIKYIIGCIDFTTGKFIFSCPGVFKKTSECASFFILIAMIFISGIIKFIQDFRSNKASEKFNDMVNTTSLIERDNIKKEIDMEEIVPGDKVYLAAGDMIPADMIILQCKDLFITQSALTGESEPVEKLNYNNNVENKNALDCSNLCFMGTTVASGTACGIVLKTGKETFLGKISYLINQKRPRMSFNKGIDRISYILVTVMLIITCLILLVNGLTKPNTDQPWKGWVDALVYALTLAVGFTPEMLPAILSLNLSKEAVVFSKNHAIIKNSNSIQTFGAIDVLCTDKTGTLTEDRIILQEYRNINEKEDNNVLFYSFLNSYFQTGMKNLIDKAIIEKAEQEKIADLVKKYQKIDEIPFDFARRRMSVVIKNTSDNEKSIITKGATEEILSICNYVEIDKKIIPLTAEIIKKVKKSVDHLNEMGMRVISIAKNYDDFDEANHQFSIKDEANMVLIGYIALLDPPKLSARKAIKSLINNGVDVKILTGDNEKVTLYICKHLGLSVTKKSVLLGSQMEAMNQQEIIAAVNKYTIFAKLNPEQKAIVVKALRTSKKTVGYMGDGINDAPAMHAADLSISVDSAVDIAKETADIILLEKDLMILNKGVIQGRKTYGNIIKYIKITISSNFGNTLSQLAALFLPFNPLNSIQILLLNIAYDLGQFTIAWDNVDIEFLKKPRNWSAKSIIRFMLIFGPISSLFDIITYLVLYFGLQYNTPEKAHLFNTGWFIECAVSQSLIIYFLRSKYFISKNNLPTKQLLVIPGVCLILILFPFIPYINEAFKFSNNIHQSLNPLFWAYLLGIIVCYIGATIGAKKIYIKYNHEHEWLV